MRDLAAKSAQPLSTITGIEGGYRMPRIDTLKKIAHALGVPAGWLASGDGIQPAWMEIGAITDAD